MAFISTKAVIAASFIAASGGGAGMASYQAHRGEGHLATPPTEAAPSQAALGPDWGEQWYGVQRAIRDKESDAGAVPSF